MGLLNDLADIIFGSSDKDDDEDHIVGYQGRNMTPIRESEVNDSLDHESDLSDGPY